jgi:hypothetical protein
MVLAGLAFVGTAILSGVIAGTAGAIADRIVHILPGMHAMSPHETAWSYVWTGLRGALWPVTAMRLMVRNAQNSK